MSENEKTQDRGIKVKGKLFTWLDNFWYHYKWHTIIITFFIVVGIVCTVQMTTSEKEDILIVYGGPYSYTQAEKIAITDVLSNVLPSDRNGDGKKLAALSTYQIFSEEQIKEIEAQTDEEGRHAPKVDKNYTSSQYENYNQQNLSGSTSICFVDPWLYEEINDKATYLCPLNSSQLFGEGVEVKGAIVEYAVRLGDTDIYKDYPALQKMPADTVIYLWNPFVTEDLFGKKDEVANQFERDAFVAIVGYESAAE
jgi:hypothetical protein